MFEARSDSAYCPQQIVEDSRNENRRCIKQVDASAREMIREMMDDDEKASDVCTMCC